MRFSYRIVSPPVFALALLTRMAAGQGVITTVAGGNGFLDNVPAGQARLDGPQALAVDAKGNAYIGDGVRIRRVDAVSGLISTVAGNGETYPLIDGAAGSIGLRAPSKFASDANGNLVFLDDNRLRRLDLKAGLVTTIAGSAGVTTNQLGIMSGVATDRGGNIFVTDDYNDKIYRIDAVTNAVTRVAGIGMTGYSGAPNGDGGPANQAGLGGPNTITLDSAGNIFFAEQYWLRRIDANSGIITTIAPISGDQARQSGDGGPVSKATLANVEALTTDAAGNLYIADQRVIRKVDWASGLIRTVAGTGQQQPYSGDGVPAIQANLTFSAAIVVDGAGNLWTADTGNRRLFTISAAGLIRTVAGTSANGDGGPAMGALFPYPSSVAVNGGGDLYVAGGDGLRRVDRATGIVSTIAPGQGQVALDAAGRVYFVVNDRVSRVDPATRTLTTVVGGNGPGFSGDGGPATAAQIGGSFAPAGIALDASGNLYIADGFRVRRVDASTGMITTIAGTGAPQEFSGMTGPAAQTGVGYVRGIAVSPSGAVYWSARGRIFTVDSDGMLAVAAGNGGSLYAGDGGPALLAPVEPFSLTFDPAGNLFLQDAACSCVRRVEAGTSLIQTVAGTGKIGNRSDSIPALEADLSPGGLAFGANTLYLTDRAQSDTNGRVRAVTPPAPPPLPQPPKITNILDGVRYQPHYSPGAIVSLLGNYLAAPVPVTGQTGANGRLTSSLAGAQVTFNGTPGPLLYVSAGQINTVIPYAAARGNMTVQLQSAEGTDSLSNVFVTETSLSLFDGLIVNPDGTVNSATNPAPKGATLILYGTGMGQTNPPGVDGAILQGPSLPRPLTQFPATVQSGLDRFTADILYLGPLPGFVAGAVQVNVRIPDTVPAGSSNLSIGANVSGGPGAASQTIYMLSDAPVLTGTNPASPIPQRPNEGLYLTLIGSNLSRIMKVNFYLDGQPVNLNPIMSAACSATSCTVSVYFAGHAGDYSVEVVNAANQVSNRLPFTVVLVGP